MEKAHDVGTGEMEPFFLLQRSYLSAHQPVYKLLARTSFYRRYK